MNEAVARIVERPDAGSRQAAWARAVARRDRLESMFKDQPYLDRLLTDGRYFKLCAAYAWASSNEERARGDLETDCLVARLRAARAGDVA